MAQQICYIITPIKKNVPLSIIHFEEKDCIIIPLLIEDEDYCKMISFSFDSQSVDEFMNNAINHLIYEYPTRKAFDFISEMKIKTFGIVYEYEHFVVPNNSSPILFIDDKRIQLSWELYEFDIHNKLSKNLKLNEILNNEKKFWSFYDAEAFYFQKIKEELRTI